MVAIEAGRQVPSTELALRLARALGCEVKQLFALPEPEELVAFAAGRAESRVLLARVGDKWVAHAHRDPGRAADGLVRQQLGERLRVRPLVDPAQLERHVLIAGCAPLLGLLCNRLRRRAPPVQASWIPAHSQRALELLARGQVHAAGLHLGERAQPEAHAAIARQHLPGQPLHLVHLTRWRQGLLLAPGNPRGIRGGEDLQRPGLRFAHREQGSGAWRVSDHLLRSSGARTSPAGPMARGHAEVAQLVRWGLADAGVAIESAALDQGLDFLPLSEERFDLIVPQSHRDHSALVQLMDALNSAAFRAEATSLPGYDPSGAGECTAVPPGLLP